jgi:glyoxylase-like metal-dependent hydrolase (beta-lactamase superfamily II)
MLFEDLEIHALPEGNFVVGTDKVFYPHDLGNPIPQGKLLVAVNPFLIITPEDIILIDTGLGEMAEDHDISTLIGHLDAHGIDREDVTKVLLSHLHFDHVGAAICTADANDGLPFPTFPNATYFAQRREMNSAYGKRSADARNHIVEVLEDHGAIEWLDEDEGWIDDRIQFRVSKGHTEFHMVFYFWANGKCVVYGGDELPQPNQINRKFFAKYDFDAKEAQRERDFISQEALSNGHLLLFYHSTSAKAAFLTAHDEKSGYKIEEAL